MHTMKKKLLTGTLAASVLLGGGLTGAIHSKAFAATDGTSTSATVTAAADAAAPGSGGHGHGKHGGDFGFRGVNVEKEAATILGVDETAIRDQQAQGKTLVQIAQDKGVTEDVLLQKLTAAANISIDAAVTAGTITQAQADQQKSGLADHLKQEVTELEHNDGHGHGKGGFGAFADPAALSQILGMTQAELDTELQAGKSLAEIADAKGISKDQLINKIKDGMTDKITQFVNKKHTQTAQAPSSSNSSDTAAN